MLRRAALSAFVLVLACGSPQHTAPPAARADIDPRIHADNLDRQLTPYIESIGAGWGEAQQFSGFVLVASGDRILYSRGFGYADWEARTPNTADTLFRIGSVTKPFTAAAILRLQERGALSVRDPIRRHIPEYPEVGANITIHHLLTHTSGIPSYTSDATFIETRHQGRTVQELLELFWDRPLEFEPGSQYQYSNSGYVVLGAILERVTGRPYAELMRELVFAPAGLERTVVGDGDGLTDRALGYMPQGDGLVPAPALDMSNPFAAGGMRSTAHDLLRWHRALRGDALLSEASKAAMYTPPSGNFYAYGWAVVERDGRRLIGHDGGIDGFRTSYVRVVDPDLAVVVWSNNVAVDPQPIASAAVRAAFGETIEPIEEPRPLPHDAALTARVVGRYTLTEQSREALAGAGLSDQVIDAVRSVDIAQAEGELTFDPVGQPALPMTRAGDGRFVVRSVGVQIHFDLPSGGEPAAGMTVRQGPLTLEYRRTGDLP